MVKNVARKSCKLTLVDFDWFTLVQELALEGYSGILYELKCELAEKFGTSIDQLNASILYPEINRVMGDMFFPDPDTTLFIKVSELSKTEKATTNEKDVFDDPGKDDGSTIGDYNVEVGEISPLGAEEGEWMASLVGALDTYFISHGAEDSDVRWLDEDLSAGSKPPFQGDPVDTPDKRTSELAQIFRDGKLEKFFKQFDGDQDSVVWADYLQSADNREESEYYIDKLFEHEFLTEQVVVYCKKTNMPTIRAKDRAALDALSSAGIVCSCGAPLKTEEIKRLVLLPAENRPLVKNTWSARTFLISILTKMGYPQESIIRTMIDDDLELIYLPAEANSLIFALSGMKFTEEMALKVWDIVEEAPNPKIVLYGAGGVEDDAVAALGTRAGPNSLVASLENLDEFSAKLLDALNKERIDRIRHIFNDFQGAMSVDVSSLAVKRLS